MSAESDAMEVVNDNNNTAEEIVEDEYQVAYDNLVEKLDAGILQSIHAISALNDIMKGNDRTDEVAVKVKEQCLYRFVLLFFSIMYVKRRKWMSLHSFNF